MFRRPQLPKTPVGPPPAAIFRTAEEVAEGELPPGFVDTGRVQLSPVPTKKVAVGIARNQGRFLRQIAKSKAMETPSNDEPISVEQANELRNPCQCKCIETKKHSG